MRQVVYLKNELTGTLPGVLHVTPKRESKGALAIRDLEDLAEEILRRPTPSWFACPKDLTIVTWSNSPEKTILERVCDHLGIPVRVYGKGRRWESNYKTKIDLMYEACCSETAPYILGMDATDAIILASPGDILDTFKALSVPMLFSAEPKLAFVDYYSDLHRCFDTLARSNGGSPFRYLNSGGWIAHREFAVEFFRLVRSLPPRPERPVSDQLVIAHCLSTNEEIRSKVRLDYNCAIFQVATTMVPRDLLSIYKERQQLSLSMRYAWSYRLRFSAFASMLNGMMRTTVKKILKR